MRKLYVHIGAHKTGTTSLQSCFDKQSRTLNKLGVLYPKTNWYHHSQHRLAFAMKGMHDPKAGDVPDLETEVGELNRAIAKSDVPKVFISSEEFFSCPPDQIAAFRAALDIDRVHIIAMLRRPDTLLLSMFNQRAKQPGNTFARGLQHFVKDPRRLAPDMNFNACLTPWIDTFGLENTTALLYEDGSSITQILKLLELPEAALPLPARLNESVPGVVIEMMRIAKFNKMGSAQQSKLFQIALREMSDRPPLFLSNADRRAVIQALQPGTGNLFRKLGLENPYRMKHFIPQEDNKPRPNLTLADMMQLVDHLLKK